MRCKTCDYPLWNLTNRQCPECGAVFKPSDYEFTPQSVRFCCPHCDQPYFGSGPTGHLVPATFDCVKCQRRIAMDEMVLRPAEGVREDQTKPASMPWLERRTRGVIRSFFQTVGLALVMPGRLLKGVPVSASVGDALTFGFLATLVPLITGLLLPLLAASGLMPLGGFGAIGVWYIGYLLLQGIAVSIALLLVWPMTAHVVLRWTGGCSHPIDRTLQAFGYAAGANIIGVVPCAGPSIAWLWWMVSSILALRQAQRVHAARVTLAVLALPLLTGVVFTMLSLALSSWAAGRGGMMAGPPGGWGGAGMQTWTLTNQLTQASWSGQPPPSHCIQYLIGNPSFAAQIARPAGGQPFCQSGTKTSTADIPVGSGTLEDFLAATPSAQLSAAAQVLNQLPANLLAHRFGDFVITCQGAQLINDPQLWTVVMAPDPDVNGVPQPGDAIYIGTGDGKVTQTTYGQLPAQLSLQNAHRATLSLPLLPDPATVTHANPAVAPAPTSTPDPGQ